jgi:hypothetical protein
LSKYLVPSANKCDDHEDDDEGDRDQEHKGPAKNHFLDLHNFIRARLSEGRPNVMPLTCGTRASTIAPRAKAVREHSPVPSGAAAG